MIDPGQFRNEIVDPTLKYLDLYSEAASNLLMGTAMQESGLVYLRQLGGGPALGLFQMEPATHDDIWTNYIRYRELLQDNMLEMSMSSGSLVYDLQYAAAMCRIHYLRVSDPLPDADDVEGLARYWKQYYNTPEGKGTVEEFIHNYARIPVS